MGAAASHESPGPSADTDVGAVGMAGIAAPVVGGGLKRVGALRRARAVAGRNFEIGAQWTQPFRADRKMLTTPATWRQVKAASPCHGRQQRGRAVSDATVSVLF